MRALILGAGRGIRRLKPDDSYPLSLIEDQEGKRVLDWIIAAIDASNISDINFVAGYHLEKVVQEYSNLRFFYNSNWQNSGSLESFLCAKEVLNDDLIIINADVVFQKEVLASIKDVSSEIAIGYLADSTEEQYSGIIKLSKSGVRKVIDYAKNLDSDQISSMSLLHFLMFL